jgi:hypothetical protein
MDAILLPISAIKQAPDIALNELGCVRVLWLQSSKTVRAKESITNMHLEDRYIAFTCRILSKNYNTVPEI